MQLRHTSIILAILLAGAFASNQHLICKSVSDVFSVSADEHRGNETGTRMSGGQGRPGKRGSVGPRGLPGPRGLKGDAGYVDYNNISQIVEERVCAGLTTVLHRLDQIQEDVIDLKLGQTKMWCHNENGFEYNGTCYSSPDFSSSGHLNREAAKLSCHRIDSELARIQDKTHQEALGNFLRPRASSGQKQFWMDMTYNPATRTLQYESGENIPNSQVTWYPGNPSSSSGNNYILLALNRGGGDGIFNNGDYKAHGVICEKKL